MQETLDFHLQVQSGQMLTSLCGEDDAHIKMLAERLNIEVYNRGHDFRLVGERDHVQAGRTIIENLNTQLNNGINHEMVHLLIVEHMPHGNGAIAEQGGDSGNADSKNGQLLVRTPQKTIYPRSPHQKKFITDIRKKEIAFGVGPAGTGKTYLAVACAVEALMARSFERLVITRPAVEAGEKLGFLPGDLSQKVDPYLRPVFDALYDTLGLALTDKLIAKQVIEVAPLAFMRGRSLNNAFVLLDEGQNTTVEQMKMFLTRMGFGSQLVITGDVTQVDLSSGVLSGLRNALDVLEGVQGVHSVRFSHRDIVRHPLVQSVVEAYDIFQNKQPHKDSV